MIYIYTIYDIYIICYIYHIYIYYNQGGRERERVRQGEVLYTNLYRISPLYTVHVIFRHWTNYLSTVYTYKIIRGMTILVRE